MFKLCCECIAGGNRLGDTAPNEEPYGSTHLNGTNHAPHWPTPTFKNEDMLLLPKKLNSGDCISITGRLDADKKLLVAALVTGETSPDYGNIACQIEASFISDIFTVKIIKDGEEKMTDGIYNQLNLNPSNYITDDQFNMEFEIDGKSLIIRVGQMDIHIMDLEHSLHDIKYIHLSGDVKITKLEFEFRN